MSRFKEAVVPVAPISVATVVKETVTIQRIPTFVFHAYVTSAIEKSETCPITLEPITKENVGCAPCGHLFDKDALKTALKKNGKCPTCRQAGKEDDIQVW